VRCQLTQQHQRKNSGAMIPTWAGGMRSLNATSVLSPPHFFTFTTKRKFWAEYDLVDFKSHRQAMQSPENWSKKSARNIPVLDEISSTTGQIT
jgi:hypothetical protein